MSRDDHPILAEILSFAKIQMHHVSNLKVPKMGSTDGASRTW
jgi:hypothetical protein